MLQVALHNTAARAFYDALGATEHHRYRYLVPPTARDRRGVRKATFLQPHRMKVAFLQTR